MIFHHLATSWPPFPNPQSPNQPGWSFRSLPVLSWSAREHCSRDYRLGPKTSRVKWPGQKQSQRQITGCISMFPYTRRTECFPKSQVGAQSTAGLNAPDVSWPTVAEQMQGTVLHTLGDCSCHFISPEGLGLKIATPGRCQFSSWEILWISWSLPCPWVLLL